MKISLTKTGCGLVVYFAVIDMYMGSKQVKCDTWYIWCRSHCYILGDILLPYSVESNGWISVVSWVCTQSILFVVLLTLTSRRPICHAMKRTCWLVLHRVCCGVVNTFLVCTPRRYLPSLLCMSIASRAQRCVEASYYSTSPVCHDILMILFCVLMLLIHHHRRHLRCIKSSFICRAGLVLKPKLQFSVKTEPKPRFRWESKSVLRPH